MKLYGSDLSPFAARCRIQIYRKGISGIEYLAAPGGLASDEFKKINPTGKIPALAVDDRIIGESEIICEYLEDFYPEHSMRPDKPIDRAQVRLLSRIADLYIFTPVFKLLPHLDPKLRDESYVKEQLLEMDRGLESLEKCLKAGGYDNGDYAVGNSLTLADCALVPLLFLQENAIPAFGVSEPFRNIPALESYWKNIQKDPHCAKVLAEMMAALTARMSGETA